MIKLYLNKLISMICLILVFFAIYLVGFSLSTVLTNLIVVCRIAFICIAAISSLIIAYNLRIKNATVKTKYITVHNDSFLKDIIYAFKSKDYIAEILAFETFVIPIFIYAAISEHTPFVPFVIGTIALIVISVFVFSLVDILLWFIVYKKWRKIIKTIK